MGFAPPPAPGSRIQELGDELIIRFAVKRSLAGAVFPLFVAGLICFGLLTDDTLTTPSRSVLRLFWPDVRHYWRSWSPGLARAR